MFAANKLHWQFAPLDSPHQFISGATVDVPNYCAEISQPGMRPISSAIQMLSNTFGISIAYVAGAFLPWRTTVFVFGSFTGRWSKKLKLGQGDKF